jgi:Flp pilus assembly pilin Flp
MMDKIKNGAGAPSHRFKSRNGQSLVEYSLVLAFISVLCIAFLTPLGVEIQGIYASIISALSQAGGGF